MDAAENAATTAHSLEQLVLKDPGLCANLLKLVNSAAYALQKKVSSVGQAMVLLGFSTVKSISAGLLMLKLFEKLPHTDQKIVLEINEHAVLISGLIRIFTAKENTKVQDQMIMVALTHDLGYIIMNQFFGKEYAEYFQAHPFPNSQNEQQRFGMDHAILGAELLSRWGFPKISSGLIWYHDSTAQAQVAQQPVELRKPLAFFHLTELIVDHRENLDSFFNTPADGGKTPEGLGECLREIGWTFEDLQQNKTVIQTLVAHP